MQMLSGVRVLDLSRLLPGPFATWLLQCHGASVTKLEDPTGGDYMRWIPPFDGELGAMFTALNRGKRSLTLDLREPSGQRAYRQLLPHFDVVLDSFRPGVMERFGLGHEQTREQFPSLVLASLTGFGNTGPWSQRPGHDLNFQALAGLLAPAARPDGAPSLTSVPMGDLAGGALMAAFTITAALLQRERTGRGTILDLSMTDGCATLLYPILAAHRAQARPPPPGADMLTGGHPAYGIYRCADGRLLTVAALEPQFWSKLRRLAGLETGTPNREEIARVLSTQPRDHWVEELEGCCVAPLLELDELLGHPLLTQRGVLEDRDGTLVFTPPAASPCVGPPPVLGADSRTTLEAAGLDFDALREEGATSGPA